jgi:hypothetical protein
MSWGRFNKRAGRLFTGELTTRMHTVALTTEPSTVDFFAENFTMLAVIFWLLTDSLTGGAALTAIRCRGIGTANLAIGLLVAGAVEHTERLCTAWPTHGIANRIITEPSALWHGLSQCKEHKEGQPTHRAFSIYKNLPESI